MRTTDAKHFEPSRGERAYILAAGQVIAEGAPQALLENEKVRRVYLGESFKL